MTTAPSEVTAAMDALTAAAQRAFRTGLQTNIGGNLSVRLPSGAIVIKASGIGFAECRRYNLVVVDAGGGVIAGTHKPSQDTAIHLALYRARADINGIVHVHSPYATGWASTGKEVPMVTFQAVEKLAGALPLIPTAPGGRQQGTTEVLAVMGAGGVAAATLQNHGVICVGDTIERALHLAELVEETAHAAYIARVLRSAPPATSA